MAKDKKFIKLHKNALITAIIVVIALLIPPLVVTTFIVNYYLRIYPHVFIQKTPVGGLTQSEARNVLMQDMVPLKKLTLEVYSSTGSKSIDIETSEILAQFTINESVKSAYEIGREGNLLVDVYNVMNVLKNDVHIPLAVTFDQVKLQTLTDTLSQEAGIEPSYPHFSLKNGEIQIVDGTPGDEFPLEYVKQTIGDALLTGTNTVKINSRVVNTTLTEFERQEGLQRAQRVLDKSLAITIDGATIQTLKVDKLLPFLNPKGGYNQDTLRNFAKGIAAENNKEVSEPIFKFDGKRVQEFTPGTNGVAVEEDLFYQKLSIALASLERTGDSEISLEVPHNKTLPQTAVSDVNNLGIKELIGEGTSRFSGSIASRIYNVALASSRINGVLVAPNETFSFASAIGDISKYTGYKEAYIIQNGKTILGDGGGVCQVSTTLFRAVMNAGLPIIERHAHAYRVGYYEQGSGPGLDATVFVPSVDFKFLNDTGHYVLVQTKVDTKNLTADFKIYGTSDGRKSTVTKPVITNQIAPPDDLYVDDPTIPAGKVVQIEHRAWGARVSFSYTVTRDGAQIYQKNFTSVYQPWQAVYQRGVGPT